MRPRGRQGELAAGNPDRALAARALAGPGAGRRADLAYEPFAQTEIARLEDLRVSAIEQSIEAKLELGRHSEVIAQLEQLVEEHPYREALHAADAALYRADRQADALSVPERSCTSSRTSASRAGRAPEELEAAVLAQDDSLAVGIPEAPVEEPPDELPSGVVTFMLTDIEGSMLWEDDPGDSGLARASTSSSSAASTPTAAACSRRRARATRP